MLESRNIYLERYAYAKQYLSIDWSEQSPTLIVVLPSHNEPDLISSLESIEACLLPQGAVSIVVVINASQNASDALKAFHVETYRHCQEWAVGKRYDYHFILENELPAKHAGVGLARKIGMDEAVRAFDQIGRDGVILCYDADSSCEPNLLQAVEQLFDSDPTIPGCSIHYEHPMSGDLPGGHYTGIIGYELHLRYYIDALQYAGFPYAYQTIGSSMATRASAYMKQGGMNRRKAGEDFYFLHRIIPLGNFKNLSATCIYPSARRSDRVPFGTGKAIGDWLEGGEKPYMTYHPTVFTDLKLFLDQVEILYEQGTEEVVYEGFPAVVRSFVSKELFLKKLKEIKSQSTTGELFVKRFYQWFDGFKVLKYVHHARDTCYPNVTVDEATNWLFTTQGVKSDLWSLEDKLVALRQWDKQWSGPSI
ncbi:hypothetical protein BFP72_07155 [Reichenbachiella sp. 5M10]|nr:hypothetical protein BFP72_07155 [Reichenbachiella sp. 5M10]